MEREVFGYVVECLRELDRAKQVEIYLILQTLINLDCAESLKMIRINIENYKNA